ncbi:Hypothetical protein D9617_1g084680 [Elsinoe fawcettii]|nr:Hypothetical protein D9617_1g084680 [Elsinoe fawcettii]
MPITTVAILGASGNFGRPTTTALLAASFTVTIITRPDSTTSHPPNIPIIRVPYTLPSLTTAFQGFDAVISLTGPAAVALQSTFIRAAHAAQVKRFIINDFGWGPTTKGLDEFASIQAQRKEGWDLAAQLAEEDEGFTWTGISTGNPIDWALGKFPTLGFDIDARKALIYDQGEEEWTGTTLQGIADAVVGVLRREEETRNRFVRVMSVKTSQGEVLGAFEEAMGGKWEVARGTTRELMERGREKLANGDRGWVLDLVVTQLLDEGEGRCRVAESWEESDSELLGVKKESIQGIVRKVLKARET